jgi:hypothetical protein
MYFRRRAKNRGRREGANRQLPRKYLARNQLDHTLFADQWMNSGNRLTISDRNSYNEKAIVEVPSAILLS